MMQGLSYELAAVVPTILETGICQSLCTIQIPDGLLVDAGQPSGNFVNVSGLSNIVVISAPMAEARLQSTEMKALEDIQQFSPRHVWLAGYYPIIDQFVPQGARAVIDGTVYDLLGSEADSQSQTTRIALRTSGV